MVFLNLYGVFPLEGPLVGFFPVVHYQLVTPVANFPAAPGADPENVEPGAQFFSNI